MAGCQQKSGVSSDENSKLDLAGKQVVKLDAFSEKRGSFDGYVPDDVRGYLEGKFIAPWVGHCERRHFVLSENKSWEKNIAKLQDQISEDGNRYNEYDISKLGTGEREVRFDRVQLSFLDFPLTFKDDGLFSGKISFVNLNTVASGNTTVITGKKDPTKPSYLAMYQDENFSLGLENTLQTEKLPSESSRFDDSGRTFIYYSDYLLIELVQRGNIFAQVGVKYELGEKVYDFPVMYSDRSSCSVEFQQRADTKDRLSSYLLRSGKEYEIDFYPLFSGAQLKEAKLIKFIPNPQGIADEKLDPIDKLKKSIENPQQFSLGELKKSFDGFHFNFDWLEWVDHYGNPWYREAPLQIADGKIPSVKLSGLSTGDYQIFVTDELNQVYTWKFVVQDKVDGKLTYQQDKMRIKIVQDSFLTGAGLSGQLDKIFGSGNYAYFIRQNWNQEDSILTRDEDYNEVYSNDWMGKTLLINYFVMPKVRYTGDLEIIDIDGRSNTYPIDIMAEEIPEARVSRDLFSQEVNVLPAKGYWADKIRIWSKNAKELKIYSQVCKRLDIGDFSDKKREQIFGPRKAYDWYDDYRVMTAELAFFDCGDAKIQEHNVPVENFQYRKRIDRDWQLPQEIRNVPYFRLSFDKTMKDAKYYMRSPVWLYSKAIPYKEVHLWAFDYVTGKPTTTWEIQVLDENGKLLKKFSVWKDELKLDLQGVDGKYVQVKYQSEEGRTFILVWIQEDGWLGDKNARIRSLVNPEQTNQNSAWGSDRFDSIKVYGYTDRVLYRPGDTVHFAGFVQDLSKMSKEASWVQTGVVVVKYGDENRIVITKLDEFWGFEGSFQLSENESLGGIGLEFIYALDQNKVSVEDFEGDYSAWEKYRETHPISRYWTAIHVEEFQKLTFTTKVKKTVENNQLYLQLTPTYYMWDLLKDYDLKLNYSLSRAESCEDCRRRESWDYYYNHVVNGSFSLGGEYVQKNLSGNDIVYQIWDLSKLGYKGDKLQLKLEITVKDNLSDETRVNYEYLDIDPEVKIGLDGYANDWINTKLVKNYQVKSEIADGLDKVKELSYEWYFKPYGFTQQVDTQGTYYYVNGEEMKLVESWSIQVAKTFSIPVFFAKYGGGSYFLKVITKDKNAVVNGEVDKSIYYYDDSFDKGFQWNMENNYTLHVNIPRENYTLGAEIPITIDPYIKGATALITAERGKEILEKKIVTLDGSPLSVKVREDFYPNVQISVVEFVGEEVNRQLGGSWDQKRSEPAFFAWYAEAMIQEDLKTVYLKLIPDKTDYRPWEQVKVKIRTTDHAGKPVRARVSLSVVDKALVDLYDEIKKPIPYFFNRIGSAVMNYSNWKNLYYALRTFFANGEKWWGGADGSLKNLRKKFYDLAFRNAAVITEWWEAEVKFSLPDNLTTWMIDAVAVSQKAQLGTQRAEFRVNQPFLLEANLPTFVTVGDQISFPLKVIADSSKISAGTKVMLNGQVKKLDGTVIQSFAESGVVNSKILSQLSFGRELFDQKEVMIEVEAKAGDYVDAVQWKIPVRTEGLVSKAFALEQKREGKKVFTFEDEADRVKFTARLAPFPTVVFAEPLEYLLYYYSKGSSESLIRTAQAALQAQKLQKMGALTGNVLENWEIKLSDGRVMSMTGLLQDIVQTLVFRQAPANGKIGSFAVRDTFNDKFDGRPLAVAAFGLLEEMRQQGYGNLISLTFAKRLDGYLNTLGADQLEFYLYYQMQKKTKAYPVNLQLIKQIQAEHPNNIAVQAMSFALLAKSGKADEVFAQAQSLQGLFDQAFAQGKYFDHKLIDLKGLQAYYLQGLLSLYTRNTAEKKEVEKLIVAQIVSLLKSRSAYGLWSWSETTNYLVLEALNHALDQYYIHQSQATKCVLKVWDQDLNIQTEKACTEASLQFEARKDLPVEWKCEWAAFLDMQVDYLLKDISKKKSELHQLERFSFAVPQEGEIGQKLELKGQFKALKEAQNMVVEFSIPSYLKLAASFQGEDGPSMQFTQDWECYPDSYEFRFDRVILRYGTMKAGQLCTFSIPAIKSFAGQFQLPASKLYEESATEVWWVSKIEK